MIVFLLRQQKVELIRFQIFQVQRMLKLRPEWKQLEKDTSQVEVSWNAITAAESSDVSYNVYRKVGSNSVECIASGVKETTYMDTSADLTLGTIKYQVSAVVKMVWNL